MILLEWIRQPGHRIDDWITGPSPMGLYHPLMLHGGGESPISVRFLPFHVLAYEDMFADVHVEQWDGRSRFVAHIPGFNSQNDPYDVIRRLDNWVHQVQTLGSSLDAWLQRSRARQEDRP